MRGQRGPIRLPPEAGATGAEQAIDGRRTEGEQLAAILRPHLHPVAFQGGHQGRQRRHQQLATQPIADLPDALEDRDHAAVVLHAATRPPPPLRGPPERSDGRLAVTAQCAAVLVQDPALHFTRRGHVSQPDGLRVFRTRWLGHRASFRVFRSVTPVVRHQPSRR